MNGNKTVAKAIQAFIIGSSWPIFIWYFVPVSTYGELANFDYKSYTFVAPIFLGLLNMIGLLVSKQFGWSKFTRFVLTALMGATFIGIYITLNKIYNYNTQAEWISHYQGLLLIYFFVFVIVAWTLEKILETV